MDFESKIISREVSEILWETEKTVSTAESCGSLRRLSPYLAPRNISRVASYLM